jgi:hypothetical protein
MNIFQSTRSVVVRSILVGSMVLSCSTTSLFSQSDSKQKSIAVTVYNDGKSVVKEVRSMELAKGTSEVQLTDVAASIDPKTVMVNFDGTVLEQN